MTLPQARPKGIDVSHHNGVVNWERVHKSKKIDFAFIKCTEGRTATDSMFVDNWHKARWDGKLIRGAYHYGHLESSAKTQAIHFVNTVLEASGERLYNGDLLALDIEDVCDESKGLSRMEIHAWITQFMQTTMKISGLPTTRCFIYTGAWWWIPRLGNAGITKYPLWLSSYTETPHTIPGWAWSIWQYSNNGTVPGISGRVDMNEYRGTIRQLRKQAGYA